MSEETLLILLKVSLVVFMAGNLLDMGLRLVLRDALQGLRDVPFVFQTLLWGFAIVPAVAYAITKIIPLDPAYAMGLILLGLTPCAPFLPAIVNRAKGDLGYTAAFMLVASVGTVLFMPFAVPLLVEGLEVSPWTIAKPLLFVILLPLVIGVAISGVSPGAASSLQPIAKKVTALFTLATAVLCVVVYGNDLLSVAGQLAVLSQIVFFSVIVAGTYLCSFGLGPGEKVVLSAGMTTRNVGAAFAPLLSGAEIDQRATVMVVLGLPMMVIFSLVAIKVLGRRPARVGP